MRFCTQCGAAIAVAIEAPQPATPKAEPTSSKPPICGRCRGFGEPGALVCRYCGAPYADVGAAPVAPAASFELASAVAAVSMGSAARIVSILKDGSDGPAFPIAGDQVDIGRSEGDVVLGDDPYLSPRHARLRRKGDAFYLRDLESVNGVYLRIREPVELADGDRILIGQQVLRFELVADAEAPLGPASIHGVLVFGTPEVPRAARLVQYTTEGVGRDVHYLYRGETILGRENGDIVFTDDPFLSRRHASIKMERSPRRFVLTDMGSSNGTALRIHGERALASGDQFRVGRHLFRLDFGGAPMMGRTAR
jgi:pSer/pThr/pTyr-binding forkhead associated (FHA) protein